MNNKLLSVIGLMVLLVGIFTVFATVVYAKGSNIFYSNNQKITVTLNDDADLNKAKEVIRKIDGVKIVKIQDRNKEWSKMVNKYDLPNMENPFKNEFIIKINRKADNIETLNKIKEMNFVVSVDSK